MPQFVFHSGLFCVDRAFAYQPSHRIKLLLFGSLGVGLTNLLLTEVYRHLPVGTVTVLHFLYPILVCLIVVVCFRKSLNRYKIISHSKPAE